MAERQPSGAGEVRWDLSDLYSGAGDPRLAEDLEASLRRAQELGERFRGRVTSLSAAELSGLVAEYEAVLEQSGRAGTFAYLDWSPAPRTLPAGPCSPGCRSTPPQLQQRLLFLELEWAHAPDERARELLELPELARYRFWLTLRPALSSASAERTGGKDPGREGGDRQGGLGASVRGGAQRRALRAGRREPAVSTPCWPGCTGRTAP